LLRAPKTHFVFGIFVSGQIPSACFPAPKERLAPSGFLFIAPDASPESGTKRSNNLFNGIDYGTQPDTQNAKQPKSIQTPQPA
jgi:hypothetical protein